LLQTDNPALRPAQHGARNIQGGGRRRPTRDDERIRQWDAALEVDDLVLDAAGEIRRDNHEMLLQVAVLDRIGRQLRADREELALHPQDDGVPFAVFDQRARYPQG
jgi:hypothetical protein